MRHYGGQRRHRRASVWHRQVFMHPSQTRLIECPMGRTLFVLMNCILNMNTRAPGIAIHRGPIEPIVERLVEEGHEFLQVPCPEATFVGLKRWWFTKELYDSVPYRLHCRRLARAIAEIAERYHNRGYRISLVGLSMSPSCGVFYTQSDPSWEGKPFDVGPSPPVTRGKGVFIEELEEALREKGVQYSEHEIPPVLIYPPYRVPSLPEHSADPEEALRQALRIFAGEGP